MIERDTGMRSSSPAKQGEGQRQGEKKPLLSNTRAMAERPCPAPTEPRTAESSVFAADART